MSYCEFPFTVFAHMIYLILLAQVACGADDWVSLCLEGDS